MNKVAVLSILAICLQVLPSHLFAQAGDRKGHDMKEVWKNMDVPEAPALSPADALKSFKIAPGFKIEIVAAEPLVEDPVAIEWDAKGRLWVVEMIGYMPNVDGKGEDAKVGQIRVLEDTNGDGKMDKASVFLDKLVMPRALAIVQGGLIVAEPPSLFYCPDADGDLKADDKIKLPISYGKQGPVEHTDNGLFLNIDNWMYNAKSSKKLKFSLSLSGQPQLEEKQTLFRGQWGITKDDDGRLYTNSNSAYLYTDFYMSDAIDKGKYKGVNQKIWSDNKVYPIRVNPGINRGYMDSMLTKDGRLAKNTASCGPGVYRGHQFPGEFQGDVFIPEPSGNVVTHWDLKQDASGAIKAIHQSYPDTKWDQRDFMASTDERFRPVAVKNGPDGALYVVDMYRGILQHRVYVTTFLRKQIIERGLDKPIGMGRIYRIVHEKSPRQKVEDLSDLGGEQLVSRLSSKNGWTRDIAQKRIIESKDISVVGSLKKLTTGKNQLAAIHALWTLEGMGKLEVADIQRVIDQGDSRLQSHALRTAERVVTDQNVTDADSQKLIQSIMKLGKKKGTAVGMHALLAAVMIPSEKLFEFARKSGDKQIAELALKGRELETLEVLLSKGMPKSSGKSKKGKKGKPKSLEATVQDLAKGETATRNARTADRMARLFNLVAKQPVKVQVAALKGVAATAFAKGQPARPIRYDTLPEGFSKMLKSSDSNVKKAAAKLKHFIQRNADVKQPRALTSAEKKLFDEGKQLYAMTCIACHLESGLGQKGVAPPLLDSPYVLGKADVPIRIVINGMAGPVTVHDQEFNLVMPPLSAFNDRQIAGVVTYIRRHWEHGADPVTEAEVAAIRKKYKGRSLPWTAKDLGF